MGQGRHRESRDKTSRHPVRDVCVSGLQIRMSVPLGELILRDDKVSKNNEKGIPKDARLSRLEDAQLCYQICKSTHIPQYTNSKMRR